MDVGNIVEYIDRQKIICAVVTDIKKLRLRVLTETNREVNLSPGRLLHHCITPCDLSVGRDKTVEELKRLAQRRQALIGRIDVRELWEVLNTEQEWIDLETMTAFCFPDDIGCDHQSAVIRAFFNNRLYFKFNQDGFFPNTEAQVDRQAAQQREADQRKRIIETGADWLKTALSAPEACSQPPADEYVDILKTYYLFGKESSRYLLAKEMLSKAGVHSEDSIFQLLVNLGVFEPDENLDLERYDISAHFVPPVQQEAARLVADPPDFSANSNRIDLTMLPVMTVDGQSTLDYDDALSFEDRGDHYRLGVHIIDVGHYVKKGDPIDAAALERGSSIYMPDSKIPMLPTCLAEDLCSLKVGELRPAISTLIDISPSLEILDWEVKTSLIRVKDQCTYFDVNLMADEHRKIGLMCDIARKFRQTRLDGGALQISLPDVNVWLDEKGTVSVNRINRESPARLMVAELMIMANWMMARFLAANNAPAIYRSQPGPKERLYKGDEGTLFQNCMQRRLLSRFILGPTAERHSGLGLEAYVTATSPIRKYFDLVTQRQIRAVLGLEEPYSREEIEQVIQRLEQPMSQVSRLQRGRNRYWLLKYLEGRIGQREEAIVLFRRRNNYQILLPAYMLECDLPMSSGIDIKPEDVIRVTLQHVNARRDVLSVFVG